MKDFMKGRYGVDDLSASLGACGVVLTLIATIFSLRPLSWIALAILALALMRALSRDFGARREENEAFRSFIAKVPGIGSLLSRATGARGAAGSVDFERTKRTASTMWKNRKTTRYLKCKSCGQLMSVPRGKGHIRVTCPKCGTKVDIHS